MNNLIISWKNLIHKPLSAILNVLLVAFGVGVLTLLLLASSQLNDKLERNAKDIDLVVGAKGSPLQLVLSSVYYADFPTGNIPLEDAQALAFNPLVNRAVPLALGDNYKGYRIVGTDTAFRSLYHLLLQQGKFWQKDFEVTIGSAIAKKENLKIGDKFYGAHGLTDAGEVHKDHAYTIVGVLEPQGNVTDNLVLTNISSIWHMHEEDENEHQHMPEGDITENKVEITPGKEITALLIQYRSPMSVVLFPRMVNESTNMQAASPALESARLFSLIGVGIGTLKGFAITIMIVSALSVFISLYSALKERLYDMALMRTMGASKSRLFCVVMIEGMLVTFMGALLGILAGHAGIMLIGSLQEATQARLTGTTFLTEEVLLLGVGFVVGGVASVLPAIQAYRADISKILAHN